MVDKDNVFAGNRAEGLPHAPLVVFVDCQCSGNGAAGVTPEQPVKTLAEAVRRLNGDR